MKGEEKRSYQIAQVSQNINYAPSYFGNKMHLWSNFSMITPCVTGLYNGGALRAMDENGVTACVSDESVASKEVDYEPITPYHGVLSTQAKNGHVSLFSLFILTFSYFLKLGRNLLCASRSFGHRLLRYDSRGRG